MDCSIKKPGKPDLFRCTASIVVFVPVPKQYSIFQCLPKLQIRTGAFRGIISGGGSSSSSSSGSSGSSSSATTIGQKE